MPSAHPENLSKTNRIWLVSLRLRWIAALLLPACMALAGWAATVEAHQGFFLGAGLAQQSGSGDLNGNNVLTNSAGTVALVDGKVSSGEGIAFDLGYGFNEYVGVELFSAGTNNTSSAPGLPDTNATVASALIGVRLTAPVSDSLDLFARAGVSGHVATFPNHVFQGTTSGGVFVPSSPGQDNATFNGTGTGVGIGAEVFMGHVGLELGLTQFYASFNHLSGGGTSGSLPHVLNETFTVGDLIVAYHF